MLKKKEGCKVPVWLSPVSRQINTQCKNTMQMHSVSSRVRFRLSFYSPAMKQLCLHLPLYQREKIASSFLCIRLQKRSVYNDWGVSSARALWEVLVLSIILAHVSLPCRMLTEMEEIVMRRCSAGRGCHKGRTYREAVSADVLVV